MRFTAKERILLHLMDFTKYSDAAEVPSGMTQDGIAEAIGILLPHVTQYARPLIREGLLRERTAHVSGGRRRRKVYDLTNSGHMIAVRLRDAVKSESIRLRDGEGIREETVANALVLARGRASLLEIVRRATEGGVVDLASLTAEPSAVAVQALAGAPRVDWFVGRRRELDTVTKARGPRIFVVRGVAGIGKSTFAARACDMLRGTRNLFWHRVRPWDSPQSVLAAVGDYLATLDRPGLRAVLARGDLAAAARALDTDLAGTQSFLVFDDVHDASPELRPFLRIIKDAVLGSSDLQVLLLSRRTVPIYDRRDVLAGLVEEIHLGGLDADEISSELTDQPAAETLIEACRAVGGHPLFLQLVRAGPTSELGPLRRDLRQFVEETVYRELGEHEREIMKVASLYRVPMPRDAFLVDSDLSHDAFLSLVDRSLLTPIGDRGFGVHDTIQDFFSGVITPAERERFAGFACHSLRARADELFASGNAVACIDCLSNALEVAPPGERFLIQERLGDAHERAGDLQAARTAYERALAVMDHPEDVCRIHRRIASALLVRGDLKGATVEIEVAGGVLPARDSLERAYVDLLRCRLASYKEEWEEAREHGLAALRIVQAAREPRGEAEVLLELAGIEIDAPTGDARHAEEYLTTALDLVPSLGDDVFRARIHNALAHLYAYRFGDAPRAATHIAAIRALPIALQDSHLNRAFLMLNGYFELELHADPTTAERYFAEAMALAVRIRDPDTVASARYALGFVAYFQERFGDARSLFERSASDFQSLGFAGIAVESLAMTAECCLCLDDIEAFRKIVGELRGPNFSRGIDARRILFRVLEGIDSLLRRDETACRSSFEEALRLTEGSPARDWPLAHVVHTFYGIALAAMGQPEPALVHSLQADRFLTDHGLRMRLASKAKLEPRLVDVLRRAMTTPSAPSAVSPAGSSLQ